MLHIVINLLLVQAVTQLNSYDFQLKEQKNSKSSNQYCIPQEEMYGFWPISRCKEFLKRSYIDKPNSPIRLYQIGNPEQGVRSDEKQMNTSGRCGLQNILS